MSERKRRRFRIRLPWIFAFVVTAVLAVMLVIAGLASAGIVSDNLAHTSVGDSTVPLEVVEGGAVVDATQLPVTTRHLPDKTIALTFDDGPDPTWTPQILSILRKYNAQGTFFVVGSRATSHPGLIRAIHDSGSELAHHTFTHPDLVEVPQWRMDRELDQTQLALAGAAGVTSYLFRPPFSSSTGAIDDLGYRTVLEAGRRGYVSVFTDSDSEDWHRPGVDAIVRNSTPAAGKGSVVLMHDSGGDRSQTVAALDKLIPQLQKDGYRFTTVTASVGMAPAGQPASSSDALSGKVLLGVVAVSLGVVEALQWILLIVGALVVVRLLLMVVTAYRHAKRRRAADWRWGDEVTDPVTVIVPAYNEKANIEVAIRSILANDHPLEVIVVDDGSTDGTADLVEALGLDRVRVIRQPNGGKATALNTGIAHAAHELIVMVDGDTIFERDTVRLLVQPFADSRIGAVSGNVKIANRDTFLTRLQHIEYVVGFNVDRRVHDLMGSMCTIPGAAGAFRRTVLLDVGGVSQETLAEDTDLTIAIGRAGWRMVYVDKAIAWTEAPVTVRQLWQQRYRWTYGTMQSVWKHRRAIVERGAAGRMGRFGLLHIIAFQILLPITAPLIDVFFVYGLFFLDPGTTLVLWLSVMLIQTAGAAFAFRMDGEPWGPLWLMPAQQLIYRQLMYVVLGQSLGSAVSGVRVRWQRMRRIGALDSLLRTEPAPVSARAKRSAPAVTLSGMTQLSTGDSPKQTIAPKVEPPAAPENWLALLAVFALIGVVLGRSTGWGWLSVAFPSLGMLFALSASYLARSLKLIPAIDAIGHGIRRFLPSLWLLGIIMIPLMLLNGWIVDPDNPLDWPQLVLWHRRVGGALVRPRVAVVRAAHAVAAASAATVGGPDLPGTARADRRRRAARVTAAGPGADRRGTDRLLHLRRVLVAGPGASGRHASPDPSAGRRRVQRGCHQYGYLVGVDAGKRPVRPRGQPAQPGAGLCRCGASPAAVLAAPWLAGPDSGTRAVRHRDRLAGADDLPLAQHRARRGRARGGHVRLDVPRGARRHGCRPDRHRGSGFRLGGRPRGPSPAQSPARRPGAARAEARQGPRRHRCISPERTPKCVESWVISAIGTRFRCCWKVCAGWNTGDTTRRESLSSVIGT